MCESVCESVSLHHGSMRLIRRMISLKINFGYQIFLIGQDFHYLDLNKLQIINQPKTTKSNNGTVKKTTVSYQIFLIKVLTKY